MKIDNLTQFKKEKKGIDREKKKELSVCGVPSRPEPRRRSHRDSAFAEMWRSLHVRWRLWSPFPTWGVVKC